MANLRLSTRSLRLVAIVPLLVLGGCSSAAPTVTASPAPATEVDQTTEQPEQTDQPTEAPTQTPTIEVTFGPGSFSLTNPTAGLSTLSSYRATLTISFDGTQDGEAAQWSRTYVMLVSSDPAARQISVEELGDTPDHELMTEMNGAQYAHRDEGQCSAAPILEGNTLADVWEPAHFLRTVIGADEAGSETVNTIAADHYTFDARALGQADVSTSAGEMWVAADGGYIVKYVLETEGSEGLFGTGSEGTLRWDYELTDANQPIAIDLPAECPAGMIDAPLLPDADDVVNMPGVMIYTSPTSIADTATFYQEQLAGLGWQPLNEPFITETSAALDFTQGEQQLSVVLTATSGVTNIHIVLGPIAP